MKEVRFNTVWNSKSLTSDIYEARLVKEKWESVGEPLIRYKSSVSKGKTVFKIVEMQKEKFMKLVSDLLDFYSK